MVSHGPPLRHHARKSSPTLSIFGKPARDYEARLSTTNHDIIVLLGVVFTLYLLPPPSILELRVARGRGGEQQLAE